MLPIADIENAGTAERLRARAAAARRGVGSSLCLSTLVLACAVGLIQAVTLFALHDVRATPPLVAAASIILGSLACLWVGSFAFLRLVIRRAGGVVAALTTLGFYGVALPLGTSDPLFTLIGLLPGALIAAPQLTRLPWPPLTERPTLPMA